MRRYSKVRAKHGAKILRDWIAAPDRSMALLWRLSRVPRESLWRATQGGYPSLGHAIRIARVLGMRVEAIWGNDVPDDPRHSRVDFDLIGPDDDMIELGSWEKAGDDAIAT